MYLRFNFIIFHKSVLASNNIVYHYLSLFLGFSFYQNSRNIGNSARKKIQSSTETRN